MGRPAFTRFLAGAGELAATRGRGVRYGSQFATWDDLWDGGQRRAEKISGGRAFVVDPGAGLEALVSLMAVACVSDTTMLWAVPQTLGVESREIAPALFEVESPVPGTPGRPLWGVCTSGSSGTPKVAIGHADLWELVALHYQSAIFDRVGVGGSPVLATCLPMQFSAAFFMTVLPSMFLRRDLVIFPPADWTAVVSLAARRDVVVLSVPALTVAACLGMTRPVAMSRVALFLGGGHVSEQRVRLIRQRYEGISVANLYGTAETGAISVDDEPGHNAHVGRPIHGKAVWLRDPDERGVGAVAVAGPDCCAYLWRPGESLTATDGYVASTDYGRFDDAGRLCLEGRVDGGEKLSGVLVHPRATERHLLTLDGVADARVLVRSADNGLEYLLARVVGRVGEDEIRAHCAVLPEIERPTRIECIPEHEAAAAYSPNGKL